MSVFKHIKEATYQIELLKKRLPNVKNKQQQLNLLKLINTFITLLNDCESLMHQTIQTDVIDKLLLARLYSQMFAVNFKGEIDMFKIVENIDTNLIESKEQQKHRIIELLRSKEIEAVVGSLPNKTTKSGYIKITASSNEQETAMAQLNQVTTPEEYENMIEELLNEFKQTIQWN